MNEELRLIISAEIEELKKEIQNANKQVKGFESQGKKSGEKFSKAMAAAGKATGAAMKAVGAAIVAAGAAIVGLAESTREYRTEQAKLTTAFESAGGSAEQAAETYNDLYRVLGDSGQATEAANLLAQMTTDQEDLSEWTRICQGAYATFGDSLPIESLAEAANETAKTGEITGALADALNWAGVSEDEFQEKLFMANSEAEREQLIRETLNGLYGEAADNYEENAASILAANEAQAALTAGMASLGAAVEPIVTLFKAQFAGVLEELAPHLETFAGGLSDVVNGVEGGSEKMAEGIRGIIDTVLNALVELLPSLLEMGVGIISALLNGIVSAFPSIIDTLAELIPQIITTIGELIPQITGAILNALPLIIEVILQVVAQLYAILGDILPKIVKQIIEILPQIVQSIVDAIPMLLEAGINYLMAIVEAIPQIIPPLVEALPQIINSIINALIDALPLLLEGAIQLFMAIVAAIPEIIPPLIKALPQIVSAVITNLISKLGDLFGGLWDGIVNIFKGAGKWFGDIFKNAFNGIKNAFSGVANFFSGIWNSIKNIFSKVGSAIAGAITNTVKSAINGVLSTAIKIINGFISAINIAIGVINLIPGVEISKLSKLSVPKLERGGVLKKGQIGLLEGNGAEAVVPLEKNTEWLDRIAERLNNSMGISAPIILQVDGKTFAQTTISSINDLTRQTGKLPLVLV